MFAFNLCKTFGPKIDKNGPKIDKNGPEIVKKCLNSLTPKTHQVKNTLKGMKSL